MFFPGVGLLLAGQNLQISTDPLTSGRRLNDVINKPCKTITESLKGTCHLCVCVDVMLGVFVYGCHGPACVHTPLTAAGKGLANFSTYSASASAWFSFPLKMICTAPWEYDQDKVMVTSATKTGVCTVGQWSSTLVLRASYEAL